MNSFKKFTYALFALVLIGLVGWGVIDNYSLIFAKSVSGVIIDVQRVNSTVAVVGAGGTADPAMFAFSIAIRDSKGIIYTSQSDDRRWAVAKAGLCADAKFYPFPPWYLKWAGGYSTATLMQLRDCTASEKADSNITGGASAGAATEGAPTQNPMIAPAATPNAGGAPNGALPAANTQAQ